MTKSKNNLSAGRPTRGTDITTLATDLFSGVSYMSGSQSSSACEGTSWHVKIKGLHTNRLPQLGALREINIIILSSGR